MGSVLQRNNVKISGKGSQAMLFAHGFGCDQSVWRFITSAFEEKYKLITFDYVGSGKSDTLSYNPEKYGDLNGYAQDILDICEELKLQDVVFVGHSVSCMTGALAAIKEPKYFSNLIFLGPSPCYINKEGYTGGFERSDIEGLLDTMEKNYVGWANFLAPVVMQNNDRPELTEELNVSFCSIDPEIARQFAAVTFYSDNRKDLPELRVPTLVLQCTDDLIAPVEVGTYVHSRLPKSTLKIMKATGHCPHMSAPGETIALINEYLN
ncbi:MAG TPA: alpha/beta hydrolase [Chitinophagaceae bacterium]|nr:alpha/beta hydrolase [Chitinophagaceae bacterium]